MIPQEVLDAEETVVVAGWPEDFNWEDYRLLNQRLDWQDRGLCAQTDPEAFFSDIGDTPKYAKRICLGCEVRETCLEFALVNEIRFGVWGGLTEPERELVLNGEVVPILLAAKQPPTHRLCKNCGEDKAIDEFYRDGKGGHHSTCKACVRIKTVRKVKTGPKCCARCKTWKPRSEYGPNNFQCNECMALRTQESARPTG